MSIIVTLATIGLVQYRQSVMFAREAVLKDDLFQMREAIDQYYADKNQYPPTLDELVSSGYLRALPKDPVHELDELLADHPGRARSRTIPSRRSGVYDVKSGSDQTAMDGTRYADW